MEIYNKKNKKNIINNLNSNKIGILPTDTIYGVSAIIKNKNNRIKINLIKESPSDKDLIILVPTIKEATKIAVITKREIFLLKKNYPTTVICKINPDYQNKDIVSKNTVAIRLVKNKFIKSIIKKTGPIYSTSANISGEQYSGKIDDFKKLPVDFIFVNQDNYNNIASKIFDSIKDRYIRD